MFNSRVAQRVTENAAETNTLRERVIGVEVAQRSTKDDAAACLNQIVSQARQEFNQVALNTTEIRSAVDAVVQAATMEFNEIKSTFAIEVADTRKSLVELRTAAESGWNGHQVALGEQRRTVEEMQHKLQEAQSSLSYLLGREQARHSWGQTSWGSWPQPSQQQQPQQPPGPAGTASAATASGVPAGTASAVTANGTPPEAGASQPAPPDPWSHYRSSPAGGTDSHSDQGVAWGSWGTWGGSWGWGSARKTEYSVDIRTWSDKNLPLDIEANPNNFLLWKNKAESYLTARHPHVCSVLEWAEKQTEVITAEREAEVEHLADRYDVGHISRVMYAVLPNTISDRLRMAKPTRWPWPGPGTLAAAHQGL